MKVPEILLRKTHPLPLIGLGTWRLRGNECVDTVRTALELGYRHFDTAHLYQNHAEIRQGLDGFPRENLFLTSKFSLPQLEQSSLEQICDQTLKELKAEYLDLFLIHYPIRAYDIAAVIREMQTLVDKQKIRLIGVSNFTIRHLQDLLHQGVDQIAINQVEFHPYLNQQELLYFCKENGIHITSFRSLGKGALTVDPLFEKIAKKHHKSAAQVSLKWLFEQGISVIPKATLKTHLKENLDIFNFTLDDEDHTVLSQLKLQHRFCENPDWSDFSYV